MPRIVVTNDQGFTTAQTQQLEQLGAVTYHQSVPQSAQEYLQRVQDADIVCSGTAGLKDAYAQLHDVFIAVPFVSVAFLDLDVLKTHNVTVSNAPGANKFAVAEWIMCMMTLLTRRFVSSLNITTAQEAQTLPVTPIGLAGNRVAILGAGNVGTQVGIVATACGMDVQYARRGNNLRAAVKGADVVVNTLSSNTSTAQVLDAGFFAAMKPGSYFISVARSETFNAQALFAALDSDRIAGAATDSGEILVGNTADPLYQKLAAHPKVLATPHTAYNARMSIERGNDIMISNIAAWIAGKPTNIVKSA